MTIYDFGNAPHTTHHAPRPTYHPDADPHLTALSLGLISLWLYPSYLGYFNLLAGGPGNGYNILVDSNVDWGQDLLRLKGWMSENEVDSVKLAWFGTACLTITASPTNPYPAPRKISTSGGMCLLIRKTRLMGCTP
ncbi:MAG: hypothetical protein IPL78_25775 [Chloroflexi bacterium]|nr:hypothetical protein [Chloroflexota bacterium]